ncbi:MAG: antibiotic biosynthesis monooxygenase [Spirochaetes bacterium]|nr:antibiotic biosynthesis monooxygenase [Spirochaetota bacterium]
MIVKVIINRKASKENEPELQSLLAKLRNRAIEQPGYISGETLKSVDNPGETIVISTWLSVEHWNKWFKNPERIETQAVIDKMLDEPAAYSVYQY